VARLWELFLQKYWGSWEARVLADSLPSLKFDLCEIHCLPGICSISITSVPKFIQRSVAYTFSPVRGLWLIKILFVWSMSLQKKGKGWDLDYFA